MLDTTLKRVSLAAFVSLLLASVIKWSLLIPTVTFSSAAALVCLKLLIATTAFVAIGASVGKAVLQILGVSQTTVIQRASYGLSGYFVSLILGQLVSVIWLFFRSGLNAISTQRFDLPLPITLYEVLLLLCISVGALGYFRSPVQGSNQKTGEHFASLGLFILALTAILLPIALRDTPRVATLSSDPDQHAFWAFQIIRLGIIPWDQGLTGQGPFNYPAGFAALNATWIVFSQVTAVDIVTIQPIIQFFLAGSLWASLIPLLIRDSRDTTNLRSQNVVVTVAVISTICLYWFVSPYGLQEGRSLGQGAGRLSVSTFVLIPILLWITAPLSEDSRPICRGRVILSLLSLAFVALMNPLSALFPAIFTGALLLRDIFKSNRAPYFTLVLTVIGVLGLLACDPYFIAKVTHVTHAFTSQAVVSTPAITAPPAHQISVLGALVTIASTITTPTLASISAILLGNRYPASIIPIPFATLVALLFIFGFIWGGSLIRRYIVACALIVFVSGIKFDLAQLSSTQFPAYLIQPYLSDATEQLGLVLGVGLCVWLVTTACFVAKLGVPLVLILSLATVISPRSPALSNGGYNLEPRASMCGPMGCVSGGDLAALSFIRNLSAEILTKYPELTYASAPKMLILNNPAPGPIENWLFPPGASRIVPLYWNLPVAFFYGQGSSDWTYENYLERICFRFNTTWLSKRNIRYLFVLSGASGCLWNKEALLPKFRVLFEQDGTRVLEIL